MTDKRKWVDLVGNGIGGVVVMSCGGGPLSSFSSAG